MLYILLVSHVSSATHLRGGHISIKQLGKTSLACRITITVYTDSQSPVLFGGTKVSEGDLLNFGDGSSPVLVPEIGPGKTPSGNGFSSTYTIVDTDGWVARATYTIDHTYSKSGAYVVSYEELNRNSGVINFDQSLNAQFYLESSFELDPLNDKAYTSPVFLTPPAFFAPAENNLSYSMAAQDSNDYTLLYELTTPNMGRGENVINYKLPESFSINQFNGLITWDTKFLGMFRTGEYTFNTKVHQFENGKRIGYIIRDFQIILEDADFNGTNSDNRDLDENNRIFIPTEGGFSFKVFAEDSEVTSLEAFSELSSHDNSFSFTTSYALVVRAKYRSGNFGKDLGYLIYTKDIELPGLDVVLPVGREQLNVLIYPNPVRDILKIEGEAGVSKTIRLLSTNGQLVLERKNFNKDQLDLTNLPTGIYVLQIESKGNIQKNPSIGKVLLGFVNC